MRTLLIFIALAVIVMVGRRLWQPRRPSRGNTVAGRMVQCAHCGVFVPEHESVRQGEHHFCSTEHRDAGAA